MRKLIDCTPFVGSAKAYGSALQNYQLAKLKKDQEGMSKARGDAAVALADLAIDVGLAASLRFGVRSVQKLTGGFLMTRLARKTGFDEIDVTAPVARRIARTELGGAAVDGVLEASRLALVSVLLAGAKRKG